MIMCLSASLFGFLLHRVRWVSCICLSMSFLKFGKLLFQSLFHHLSFSLILGTPQCIYWSVAMYHRLSFSLCSLFFISPPLCSSDMFSGVLILSYTYSSLMNPISGFFFSIQFFFQVQNFCSLYNFYLIFIFWFCSYIVFLISFTLLSKFSFIS